MNLDNVGSKKMKKIVLTILILLALELSVKVEAGQTETIPVGDEIYEWVYEYIDQLYLRGYFRELHTGTKPFYRGEVASLVLSLEDKIEKKEIQPTKTEKWMIREMEKEFSYEISALRENNEDGKELKLGLDFLEDAQFQKAEKSNFFERGLPFLGGQWGKGFSFLVRYNIDESLARDPYYTGKVWNGFAGEAHQAYLSFHFPYFELLLGREKLSWGQSKISSLIMSEDSSPADMLKIQKRWGCFQGTAFAGFLNPMISDEGEEIERYFSGHRVSFKILSLAELGFSETVVYGGKDRNLEPYYLNPLFWYHGAQLNNNRDDNTFICFDFNFTPKRSLLFYGEFLIDDFQIEKKLKSDQEPNELGYVLGFSHVFPSMLNVFQMNIEYDRINNRTFNQKNIWNRYLNRNRLIGSKLGPNSDYLKTSIKGWLTQKLEAELSYGFLRKGEGSVYSSWEEPWLYVEGDYKEKFPFGVVEKTDELSFGLGYNYDSVLRLGLSLQYSQVANKNNVLNKKEKNLNFRFLFQYHFAKDLL
jgi:hypothetical protein